MRRGESGATAVFVGASLLLLLGVVAVALDLSAGYNERNQDQNAADNAVMAGALDMAAGLDGQTITASVLEYAMPNITADFPGGQTDPEWVEMWRACVDDGNPNWVALPEPAGWSGIVTASNPTGGPAPLDCISRTTSLLRVRVPDQLVGTAFAKIIGIDSLSTHAVAIAKTESQLPVPPVVPYGIAGSATAGEQCFGTAPPPASYPPCSGPSSGTFGTLLSELFGDFYGEPNCENPTSTQSIRITTAVGLDHRLDVWQDVYFGPHPGDNVVLAMTPPDTNRDACVLDPDGNATPIDGYPINTVTVDSGFPSNEMEAGLVSNDTFAGRPSRLQQWSSGDPTRTVVRKRTNGNGETWELDNTGPWEFLDPSNTVSIPECDPNYAAYQFASATEADTLAKVAAFNSCLTQYDAGSLTDDIFVEWIDDSPRFVWAPQYVYDLPTTGLSYQPIRAFRPSFIGGTFFNCGSAGCAVTFYPDSDNEDADYDLCDFNPNSLNCAALSLDQFSAWLFPDEAIPDVVWNRFEDALDSLEPVLWQ